MRPDAPPTVRQVYALAAVLCQMCDEAFPKDREAASALIERFRRELGHPHPQCEDAPSTRHRRPDVSEKTERIRAFHRELNAE